MNIDLIKLITNIEKEINLNIKIDADIYNEMLSKTSIKVLKNVTFVGKITRSYNDDFQISGTLKGIMILPDDITLEDVEHQFESNIEEKINENSNNTDNNLKIIKNRLDISEFLWQNILVEIPMKVVNNKNKNITLEGNGWRLITEEELNESNNSPFAELKDKFK